jgi:hypothetical protein
VAGNITSKAIKIGRPAPRARLTLLWAFGRIPLVFALLYVLRRPLLDAIEAKFDIVTITLFTIDRASTQLTRAIVVLAAGLLSFAIAKARARLTPRRSYLWAVTLIAVLTAIACKELGGRLRLALATAILIAANWAPLSTLERFGLGPAALDRVIAILPGVAEIFFTSRYLDWLRALLRGERRPGQAEEPRLVPGAIVAALALAVLLPGYKLVRFERAMRLGPDVTLFARGDFNGLAYDARDHRLLATGHGVPRPLGFDANNLAAAPLIADTPSGDPEGFTPAQGFAYDPAHDELYAFNGGQQRLLVFDAATLKLKRSIPAPDISPGDSWIGFDPISNTLTIASEADVQTGYPLVVLDRASGAVVDKRGDEAGNLLINPEAPIIYMSFFRRTGGVIAYDLKARKVLASAPADARMDRMAYDPLHKEVLIASPAEGRIQRFDATTLTPAGAFQTIFGARVIAVDAPRRVILVGSLATGEIALMGLDDRRVKRTWYLGPWLRSIEIAPGQGVAYVSSNGCLYQLRYARGA